jgi:ligand-binding sensor domain-containing protein
VRGRRHVLIAAMVALVTAPVAAQDAWMRDSDYAVTAWTTESGFPAEADAVLAITQDRDGYLWLGTRNGLVRFDGLQFSTWGSRGEPALPGRRVRALVGARAGSIWV